MFWKLTDLYLKQASTVIDVTALNRNTLSVQAQGESGVIFMLRNETQYEAVLIQVEFQL